MTPIFFQAAGCSSLGRWFSQRLFFVFNENANERGRWLAASRAQADLIFSPSITSVLVPSRHSIAQRKENAGNIARRRRRF